MDFASLENTWLAMFIDNSSWGYPFFLTIHGLGMAVVVGLTAMTSLRILGFPRATPLGSYSGLTPYVAWAFLFNFLSGAALFISDADALAHNPSFQIKIGSIIVGLLVFWQLNRSALQPSARALAAGTDQPALPKMAKLWAILTILIWWLSVLVSGRLVAYLAAVK